jgi:magnesium chelatase family protein
MLASVRTAAVFGIEAVAVSVEVDVSFGLPGLVMVGLPDAAVRESRDRVRSAIRNSGFAFPQHRVTVNLAPADVRKAGAAFDLPIALGVLAATGIVTTRLITDALLVGELSLDGSMQPARGVLPIAASARRNGCHRLLLPSANAAEASIVEGLRVLPVNSLQEAVDVLNDAVEPRAVARPQRRRHRSTNPTWRTCRDRRSDVERSKWPRPAATTCCSSARPAPARPCSRGGCRDCCRRLPSTSRSR